MMLETHERVEFYGGPCDGMVSHVRMNAREVRFPMSRHGNCSPYMPGELPPECLYMNAMYKRDGGRFVYVGIEYK